MVFYDPYSFLLFFFLLMSKGGKKRKLIVEGEQELKFISQHKFHYFLHFTFIAFAKHFPLFDYVF